MGLDTLRRRTHRKRNPVRGKMHGREEESLHESFEETQRVGEKKTAPTPKTSPLTGHQRGPYDLAMVKGGGSRTRAAHKSVFDITGGVIYRGSEQITIR